MSFGVDLGERQDPHVNYEPSITGGLREGRSPGPDEQGPVISGRLTRKRIPLTNDYLQAGQRYQLLEQWEKNDLVGNFVTLIGQAVRDVQERMVWHFLMVDDELGLRVGEGLGVSPDDVRHLEPLPTQVLSDDELQRMSNLGKNGPRDVTGLRMTHCVPNEHVVIDR